MAREILEGHIFGDFTAVEYLGSKKYKAVCNICGEVKEVYVTNLKRNVGVTCSSKKNNVDLTHEQIGEWYVQEYVGNKKYRCICSCGAVKDVLKANLINGSSTSCGHSKNNYGDLSGKKFGDWIVLERAGYKWKCLCSCGKIGYATAFDLVNGRTKSCGHGYNEFNDITGKVFGSWEVIEYKGNQNYLCKCKCNNTKIIRKADLLSGKSTSCGCSKAERAKETMLERYCEVAPNKVSEPRTPEQILAISSGENLRNFIGKLGYKPTPRELATELGIKLSSTWKIVHKYNAEDLIGISSRGSIQENELYEFVSEIYNGVIEKRNRSVISPYELDIYIPDKKIAIEFNGNYWHSSLFKETKYHQNKTLDCARKGVRLIHIFEYEWIRNKDKVKMLLNRVINGNNTTVYARNTVVSEIITDVDKEEAVQLCNKYHIQGWINAQIIFGCYVDKELVSIMSFGKARFDNNYSYEIIRYCVKDGITVVGGAQKLFKKFVDTYKPESVLTYSDISKFTGSIYLKLGFKVDKITEPNYVWTAVDSSKVLSRYQTQKHKLIGQGVGNINETEDEIMYNNEYLKICDCGNIKLVWKSKT